MVEDVVRYRMLGAASFPFLTAIGRFRSTVQIEGDTEVIGSELVPYACF